MGDLPLEHVYVEPDAPTAGADPAVVVLHGRGADERDLLPVVEHLPGSLAAVSLRGPDPVGGGYRWYEIEAPDGLETSQPDPEGYRRSLDLVADAVDAAVGTYDLDPDAVGLLGFSMGSMLGMGLVLESPGQFAWLAGLHGYLPASHADRDSGGIEGKPVFLGGGRRDRVVPASRVETAAERFRELGADVTLSIDDGGHGVGPEELRDLVAFVGGQVE